MNFDHEYNIQDNKKDKTYIKIIALILGIIVIILLIGGISYAYMSNQVEDTGISGSAALMDISVAVETSIDGGKLIPMEDSDLASAISYVTPCIDSNGKGACKVYTITVTNKSSDKVNVASNIVFNKTGNLDNLKWQELSSTDSIGTITGATNGISATLASTTATSWRKSDNIDGNGSKVYYIAVWISNINDNQNTTDNGSYTIEVTFGAADGQIKGDVITPSFASDSWETIAKNVAKDPAIYDVGDTKCITVKDFTTTNDNGCSSGGFLVRVANNTSPNECKTAGFSQTACGFVVEFVDIISQRAMNSSNTNEGSWPSSEMYTYVNETIYKALPTDLQSVIILTKSVTGHGDGETTNFVSNNDKLYLLSPREVWDYSGSTDTGNANTRQLDYYKSGGVTTSNYSGAIKQYNGSNSDWWLREPNSNNSGSFWNVISDGDDNRHSASNNYGISPAFRIG